MMIITVPQQSTTAAGGTTPAQCLAYVAPKYSHGDCHVNSLAQPRPVIVLTPKTNALQEHPLCHAVTNTHHDDNMSFQRRRIRNFPMLPLMVAFSEDCDDRDEDQTRLDDGVHDDDERIQDGSKSLVSSLSLDDSMLIYHRQQQELEQQLHRHHLQQHPHMLQSRVLGLSIPTRICICANQHLVPDFSIFAVPMIAFHACPIRSQALQGAHHIQTTFPVVRLANGFGWAAASTPY